VKSKLNILLISSFALPVKLRGYGGLERVVYLLAKGLSELGHKVTIVTCRGSEINIRGVEVVEVCDCDFSIHNEKLAYSRYRDLVSRFDIVNDHSWLKLSLREFNNVVGTHHAPIPPLDLLLTRSRIVLVSESHSRYVEDRFGVKLPYVRHGIDPSQYPYREGKEDYVLFLNRIDEEKGALTFVKWCRKYNLKCIVAGEDKHVGSREYVEKVMRECNGKHVEFWGRVDEDEKIDLLSHAKCVVSFSGFERDWVEVFGLFILESLACGTPVLVYDTLGGPKEIVEFSRVALGKVVGYTFTDLEDAYNKLRQIGNVRSSDCREVVEKYFNYTRMSREYLEVFKKFIALEVE